jgi:hypothetical protein
MVPKNATAGAGDSGDRKDFSGNKLSDHSQTFTELQVRLPLAALSVGQRHRHDMGDIAGLAASMAQLGLLHPIVVRPDAR